MTLEPALRVKIADDPAEFEQIHALNYRTFVEEIPRYVSSERGRYVDRFHDENTYVIALRGTVVEGMLAIRERRPFSLDDRLRDVDAYLPHGCNPCEPRLLAVERSRRGVRILPSLVHRAWEYLDARGYDLAVISGTTRQLKLYTHLGFEAFGPLVGTADALFQPMMLRREAFVPVVAPILRGSRAG